MRATINSSTIYSKKAHWSNIAVTYVAIFALLFQPLTPAIGAVLSDSYIQDQLNSYSNFETNSSGEFEIASFLDIPAPVATDLANFVSTLDSSYRHTLGAATLVPIGVGDITTFIPTYKKPPFFGSPAVQSRYIRGQVQNILGRTLINPNSSAYSSEAAQLNTLYANAFRYINSQPSARYGKKLNVDQENSGLAYDMIWPEFRIINGKEVVVPIVYLSAATVANHRVSGNVIEFNANVSLGALNIENVDIQFGRQTFLKVANDLLNNQGSITSEGELEIVVGGALRNLSGVIQAQGDLRIGAHGIENQTIIYRYIDEGLFLTERGTRYGQIASISSVTGDLTLRSYSDIIFRGATASAGQDLRLAADGSIYIGSQELQTSVEGYQYGNYTASTVDYLQSTLTANDTLQLIANGEIIIDAAELVSSQGHIEILAGLGVTIEDDLSRSQFTRTFRRGQESAYKTVAMRALLDAGKGIRIHSEYGDITLRATDITSSEGTSITASNGGVNLLMTVENDHYRYNYTKKGTFTTKTINRGHDIETGVPNSIVGGLVVESLNGLTVEYEGDPNLSLDEQIAELSKFEGLEWMADVRANTPNVDWQAIELKYEEWNISRRSLSPAFAAVIAITLAVATGGGASIIGETLAAGSYGAALGAGALSLVTQATLALGNGLVNGDIGEALETLASSNTLKSLAIAMVTAGAIDAIDADFFNATGDTPFDVYVDTATREATLSLAGQATQAVTHAVVRAGVDNLVSGGNSDSFEDYFVQSLGQSAVNGIGKYAANEIKASFDIGGSNPSQALRYISHAAVGCVLGAVTAETTDADVNNSCAAGAGGAVIGELIADDLRSNSQAALDAQAAENFLKSKGFTDFSSLSDEQIQEYLDGFGSNINLLETSNELVALHGDVIDAAKLGAALGAFISGADAAQINIAANAGQNAAENNAVFLIPAAIFLLKAADIALTVYDIKQFKDAYDAASVGSDPEEVKKAQTKVIKDYFGEKVEEAFIERAVGALIPGGATIGRIIDFGVERGIISRNTVDKVRSAFDFEELDAEVGHSNLKDNIIIQNRLLDDIGVVKPPARPILVNEDILIDETIGLQSRKVGIFDGVVHGLYGEDTTKYLYTIDARGVNIALESTPFPTPRGNIVHSNISEEASMGGEVWFSSNNTVIINAGSGRFGDGANITSQQWDSTIQFWENLGYTVSPIPFGER